MFVYMCTLNYLDHIIASYQISHSCPMTSTSSKARIEKCELDKFKLDELEWRNLSSMSSN